MTDRWKNLVLAFLVVTVMFIPYVGYSLTTLEIIDEFSVNYTQIGLLATFTALAIGFVLPFAGYLTDRYGSRTVTLISLIIVIIGQVAFASAINFPILLLSRLIIGIGIAGLFIAPYTLVIKWFSDSKILGLSMGIMIATDGIGTFAATYLFALLYTVIGWRESTYVSAAVLLILFLISWISMKNAPVAKNSSFNVTKKDILGVIKNRNVIGGIIYLTSLTSIFSLAVYWIPTILIEEINWSESLAGFIGALFAIFGIIGSFIFGALSDKQNKRKLFILLAKLGMCLAFIACTIFYIQENYLILAFLLPISGFFGYGGPSVVYALAAETVKENMVGLANGLILGLGILIGGSIVPVLIGAIKDSTNSYTIGFIILVIYLVILFIISLFLFKDSNKSPQVVNSPTLKEVES